MPWFINDGLWFIFYDFKYKGCRLDVLCVTWVKIQQLNC